VGHSKCRERRVYYTIMKSSKAKSNDVVLRRTLQEHGHRFTDQRAAVFRLVARSRVHPTAEDVFLGVQAEVPGISLATVYKSLETLVNCGLAKKLTPPEGSARFCGRTDPHHHARCLACGGVSDVPGELGEAELTALRSQANGFHLLGYDLELTGYCSDCSPPTRNRSGVSSH
jgi:Fe2+ or Zn2+ uptake regulation protein